MVFLIFIFIFLFRIDGKKGHLDKNEFRHCYGKGLCLKITAMFKGRSQQLEATLTAAFLKAHDS